MDVAALGLSRVGDDVAIVIGGARQVVALPKVVRGRIEVAADWAGVVVRFAPGREAGP
ncbi:hypothetical protein [Actinokineospora baliensis]|uniref:hypothetical protein n=1 Tax=Actinokineospora baliensis TaxID=547056 RepID=UPI0035588967